MSAIVLAHLHLSWISNIRHSALISSLLEILTVSGSCISGHAHTWCVPTKSGRLHGSVQTCDCTHCKHFNSWSLEETYPLCPQKVDNNKVFEEPSCRHWNKCHSDPSCTAVVCQHSNHTEFLSFAYLAHLYVSHLFEIWWTDQFLKQSLAILFSWVLKLNMKRTRIH